MKKQKIKKRAVTLIEIMIVILLIGLISGALIFNMRGSVDKGRVFKSQQNAQRVYDALMMAYAAGEISLTDIENREIVLNVLKHSPFIKNSEEALRDGWGNPLIIQSNGSDDIIVFSPKVRELENAQNQTH